VNKVKLDITKDGLNALFKPYQGMILEHIWALNNRGKFTVGSREAHSYLAATPEKKSRAAVIFFLNDMVDEGVLDFDDRTGKGGHHRLYYPKMNRDEFADYAVRQVVGGLVRAFPEGEMALKIADFAGVEA